MSFSTIYPISFVCLVFFPVMFTAPTDLRLGLDTGRIQLNYIGTIEGKSFFTEQNVSLTWLEAKAYCNASGMHLASITTKAQLEMLKAAYSSTTFSKYVWTGARDSLTPMQFSWDHDGEVLNATVHSDMVYYSILTCVGYHPLPNENCLHAIPCTYKRAVLCEIITMK